MRRKGGDNHRPPLLFCVWIVSAGLIAIQYHVWYSTISHEEAQNITSVQLVKMSLTQIIGKPNEKAQVRQYLEEYT